MKRITIFATILMVLVAGAVLAKQWDQYTDFSVAPNSADTLLIYDTSETDDAEKIKEVTVANLMKAWEVDPVYVSLAGTSIYTIDPSLGNMFFIDTVGSYGTTGTSIYLPNLAAGTSQYANRPIWIINDTVSGTTKVWLVPQYNTSQCTQWIVAGAGVTSGQVSGTSRIGHERMDSRMDSVMLIPRYVSATGGVTYYIVDENIH